SDGNIQFSLLDLSDRLTVTDPNVFTRALFRGIGPAKGFGCGLLLVRRV
ncbi:MAG: type I-E CRISPR-associated protein Cas6/Cse3/CasE, partial [Candidatus Electrothrix sp. LOE2]|nr:type I-E CRISPR-associated protein Cas6/Cse3/CasE [Candidatus Electrothrix sp. LOE2]